MQKKLDENHSVRSRYKLEVPWRFPTSAKGSKSLLSE